MSQSYQIAKEYYQLMKAGERFARAVPNIEASQVAFRKAQSNFVSLLRSPEMGAIFGHAYGGINNFEGHEDAVLFLNEFLEGNALEKEIDLTCFSGLKRTEVRQLIQECKYNPHPAVLPERGLTCDMLIDQINERCNEFVTLITTSRALDRNRKKKWKTAAYKALQITSFGAVCAVINVPLAIPTIGIAATISLGLTASASVLALQYGADLEG